MAPGAGFIEDNFPQTMGWQKVSVLLAAHLLLGSWFLTDHELVLVHGLWGVNLCSRVTTKKTMQRDTLKNTMNKSRNRPVGKIRQFSILVLEEYSVSDQLN